MSDLQEQNAKLAECNRTQERTIDRKNRELLAKDRALEGANRHIAWLEGRLERETGRKPTPEEFAEYLFGGE